MTTLLSQLPRVQINAANTLLSLSTYRNHGDEVGSRESVSQHVHEHVQVGQFGHEEAAQILTQANLCVFVWVYGAD